MLLEASDFNNILWDYEEALEVLHRYTCVLAVICGHYHDGAHAVDSHGIHHLTLPGTVEREPDSQAYATIHVSMERMQVNGVGEVPSITIPIKWS